MAGSLNKVSLIGHLGNDPDTRRTQSGSPVVSFSIATSESWRDKSSGDRREKTDWHNVVIWNEGLCKIAEQYLRKGSKVYIEGKLQTRKWTDQAGVEKYTTEVVLQFDAKLLMLSSKEEGGGGNSRSGDRRDDRRSDSRERQGSNQNYGGGGSGGNFSRDLDDDIPFEMPWR